MGFIRTFGRKEGCRPTNTRTVHSYLYAYNYGMPKRKRPLRFCDRLRLLQLQHKHGFLQYLVVEAFIKNRLLVQQAIREKLTSISNKMFAINKYTSNSIKNTL